MMALKSRRVVEDDSQSKTRKMIVRAKLGEHTQVHEHVIDIALNHFLEDFKSTQLSG